MIGFWFGVVALPAGVGLGWVLFRQHQQQASILAIGPKVQPGYVYFLSTLGGAEEEPPALVKVGMTHRDPSVYRLPEIETMSPKRLVILDTIPTPTPEILEHVIHRELAAYRHHGEWFDRDATLAWLDNYKGGHHA